MGGIEITAKSPDSLGNLDFTTFSEREAQSTPRVLISSLGRHYDRFSVRVELSQPEVAERPHLWVRSSSKRNIYLKLEQLKFIMDCRLFKDYRPNSSSSVYHVCGLKLG